MKNQNQRVASVGHLVMVALTLGVFLGLAVGCGGCGMPKNMSVGGYDHKDMSKSQYRDIILEQAETLAGTTNPEDWRTAAKYYGSIGMLDEMDRCIRKYVEKEPEVGIDLIYVGEQVHQFYEGKKK
ncbi:MAG: hypothetical protein JXN61_16250 [Sedimentisphaerales bacterium]|nr:hypothetical protein [Sedimentisphaerales bacterium]